MTIHSLFTHFCATLSTDQILASLSGRDNDFLVYTKDFSLFLYAGGGIKELIATMSISIDLDSA